MGLPVGRLVSPRSVGYEVRGNFVGAELGRDVGLLEVGRTVGCPVGSTDGCFVGVFDG